MDPRKFFKPVGRGFEEIPEEQLWRLNFFFAAPSLEKLESLTRFITGACAKKTELSKMVPGRRYNFKAGDPVRFFGIYFWVVSFPEDSDNKFAEIGLSEEVFYYSSVRDNFCSSLEIFP